MGRETAECIPELIVDFENKSVREEVRKAYNLTELRNTLNTSKYALNETVPKSYTVRPGDSLWKISRRFSTSVNTLCTLNGLNKHSVLQGYRFID